MKKLFFIITILSLFIINNLGRNGFDWVDDYEREKVMSALLPVRILISVITGILLFVFYRQAFEVELGLSKHYGFLVVFIFVSFFISSGWVQFCNGMGKKKLIVLEGKIADKFTKGRKARPSYFLGVKGNDSIEYWVLEVSKDIYEQRAKGDLFNKQFKIGLLNIKYSKE